MDKQESGEQPKALAMTILAAAQNIDKLEVLLQAVKKVGGVHINSKVKPEHYPATKMYTELLVEGAEYKKAITFIKKALKTHENKEELIYNMKI